jgi:hypothetical protein
MLGGSTFAGEGGNCHVSNIEHVSVRLVVYLGDAEMDNVRGVGPTVDAFIAWGRCR